jgi:hypothetical protein
MPAANRERVSVRSADWAREPVRCGSGNDGAIADRRGQVVSDREQVRRR